MDYLPDEIDVRLSPEIANLFLMAILCLLFCWLVRLARLLFSLSELRIAISSGQLLRMEANDELYNEMDVLSVANLQHLVRTRSSISLDVSSIKVPFAIKSVGLVEGVETKEKHCEITYDSIGSGVVSAYWGVNVEKFNERCRTYMDRTISNPAPTRPTVNKRHVFGRRSRDDGGGTGVEMGNLNSGRSVASRAVLADKGEDDGSPTYFRDDECFLEAETIPASYGMGMKILIAIPPSCGGVLKHNSAHIKTDDNDEEETYDTTTDFGSELERFSRLSGLRLSSDSMTMRPPNLPFDPLLLPLDLPPVRSSRDGTGGDVRVSGERRLSRISIGDGGVATSADVNEVPEEPSLGDQGAAADDRWGRGHHVRAIHLVVVIRALPTDDASSLEGTNGGSLVVAIEFSQTGTPSIIKQLYVCAESIFDVREMYGLDEQDASSVECTVCLSDPKEVLLLPCRHFCVCHTCFKQLPKCPICRCNYKTYIRFHKKLESLIDKSETDGLGGNVADSPLATIISSEVGLATQDNRGLRFVASP